MPLDAWDAFARDHRLPVLIDAAAALPRVAPAPRVHVAFSLHATKPLGIGEGGLVATCDAALADRVRRSTNHGFSGTVVEANGTNGRMSEYAAAVGLAQLARFGEVRDRRRRLWALYGKTLAALDGVRVQAGLGDEAPAVLVVTTPVPATEVARILDARSIETRRWYGPPLHGHPAYATAARAAPDGSDSLVNADWLASHAIGLPFHTRLGESDVARVGEALRDALALASASRRC
jgi:dTDP-4-amino-4,6-dideoxygalactose transaminase